MGLNEFSHAGKQDAEARGDNGAQLRLPEIIAERVVPAITLMTGNVCSVLACLRVKISRWRAVAAGVLCTAVFLALTIPSVPIGPVIGTGQDEWYNMIRGLRALYDHLDPSYFIHPALYYELLSLLYGLERVALQTTGTIDDRANFLAYVLANQSLFLDLARYASIGCGALAVMAAVWLGTVLAGTSAGLLAGLIVASLPLLHALAASIRVDALYLATVLAGSALVVRHYRRACRHSLAHAAAGIGVAAAANYPGALLLVLLAWCEWVRPGDDSAARRMLGFAAAYADGLNPAKNCVSGTLNASRYGVVENSVGVF